MKVLPAYLKGEKGAFFIYELAKGRNYFEAVVHCIIAQSPGYI